MSDRPQDSLAFKTFLYCPIPGVDLLAGATVFAATAVAEACADGVKNAVKEGISEAVSDCQREVMTTGMNAANAIAAAGGMVTEVKVAVSEGLGEALALSEAAVHRQLAPLASSLDSLASAISSCGASTDTTESARRK